MYPQMHYQGESIVAFCSLSRAIVPVARVASLFPADMILRQMVSERGMIGEDFETVVPMTH